jgi:hypothetical protein
MIVTKGLGSNRLATSGYGWKFGYAEIIPVVVQGGWSGGGGSAWNRLGYVPYRDRPSDYVVMSRRPRRGKGPLKGFDILSEIADEDAADDAASDDLSLFSDVEQTRPKTQDWWSWTWPTMLETPVSPPLGDIPHLSDAVQTGMPKEELPGSPRPSVEMRTIAVAGPRVRGSGLAQATGGAAQRERKGWSTGTKVVLVVGALGLCTAAGYLVGRHLLRSKARRIEAAEMHRDHVPEPLEGHRRGGKKAKRGQGCRAGRACHDGAGRVG